jgi:hypothetical protein
MRRHSVGPPACAGPATTRRGDPRRVQLRWNSYRELEQANYPRPRPLNHSELISNRSQLGRRQTQLTRRGTLQIIFSATLGWCERNRTGLGLSLACQVADYGRLRGVSIHPEKRTVNQERRLPAALQTWAPAGANPPSKTTPPGFIDWRTLASRSRDASSVSTRP